MLRRPPRSTLFPSRRSSDLRLVEAPRRPGRQAGPRHVGRLRPDADAVHERPRPQLQEHRREDRKSTRLNSSHVEISYAVFCLKKKKKNITKHKEADKKNSRY